VFLHFLFKLTRGSGQCVTNVEHRVRVTKVLYQSVTYPLLRVQEDANAYLKLDSMIRHLSIPSE